MKEKEKQEKRVMEIKKLRFLRERQTNRQTDSERSYCLNGFVCS